jgi:hypothetical protein
LKEVSKGFGGSTTGPSYISPLACRIAHGEWAVPANFSRLLKKRPDKPLVFVVLA